MEREIKTPKEAARELIKFYVLRGDSLESLKRGQLGHYSSDSYNAQIGGYANEKRVSTDKIIVKKIKDKELKPHEIFSLKAIFEEIKKD